MQMPLTLNRLSNAVLSYLRCTLNIGTRNSDFVGISFYHLAIYFIWCFIRLAWFITYDGVFISPRKIEQQFTVIIFVFFFVNAISMLCPKNCCLLSFTQESDARIRCHFLD